MVKKLIDKLQSDTSLKKLVSGSSLVLIFKLIAGLSSYFFYLLLSKEYGLESVGKFTVAFTVVNIASVIARFGLDNAIVRLVPQGLANKNGKAVRQLIKRLVFITFGLSLLVAIAVYFLRFFIADILDNQDLVFPILISSLLIVPFTLCIMLAETYRALGKNWGFSLMQQGSIFLFMAILGFTVFKHLNLSFHHLLWTFLALFFTQLLFGGFSLPAKLRALAISETDEEYHLPEVMKLAWPMFISGSAVLLMSWTDTLILAYFETEDLVGIYNISFKIATLVTIVQFAINVVSSPMMARLYKEGNQSGLAKLVKQITWLNTAVALPTLIIFIFFGDWFLNLFGSDFTEGKYALIILSIGQVIAAITGPVMPLLNMTDFERIVRNIISISAGLNILLNILLIPYYGIVGAAIASAIVMAFWNLVGVIVVKKKLGFWCTSFSKS